MSETEYEAALSDFLRSKRVTRCPTACVSPTYGTVAGTDRNALRSHADVLEAARLEKLSNLRGGRHSTSADNSV
jgi:hypothetical protein